MRRQEGHRKLLDLGTGTVSSVTNCYDFYVCMHSQTCKAYKRSHCQKHVALLSKLQKQNVAVETC